MGAEVGATPVFSGAGRHSGFGNTCLPSGRTTVSMPEAYMFQFPRTLNLLTLLHQWAGERE